jgi:hypothetical protein
MWNFILNRTVFENIEHNNAEVKVLFARPTVRVVLKRLFSLFEQYNEALLFAICPIALPIPQH